MSNLRIALLDSGLGGLPYHRETKRLLPKSDCIYIADRANYPYGALSIEALGAGIERLVEKTIAAIDPDVVVLACNTASVTALSSLRARYSPPFVGVVPAVKPAAAASVRRRIGVLSTAATARADYLSNLVREHAAGCEVCIFPAGELVDWVEKRMPLTGECPDSDEITHVTALIQEAGVDQVVLGCTHFLHIKALLTQLLGAGVRIVDSAEGVARQIARVAWDRAAHCSAEDGTLGAPAATSHTRLSTDGDELYISAEGDWSARYREAASAFGLRFSGVL